MPLRVLRAVYRAALRNVVHFDRNPALKALLSRDPGAPHAQRPGGGCEFDAALERFLGSGQFYVPSLPSPRGARDALRTAFRAAPGGGDLDAGFQAIRALQHALNRAKRLQLFPARARVAAQAGEQAGARADADSRWALLPPGTGAPRAPLRPLAAPQQGALLISHPRLGSPGEFFHRKVVLLTSHDHRGSHGLVLNCPMGVPLDAVRHLQADKDAKEGSEGDAANELPRSSSAEHHSGMLALEAGFPTGLDDSSAMARALRAASVFAPRARRRRDGSVVVSFHVPSELAHAAAAAVAAAVAQRGARTGDYAAQHSDSDGEDDDDFQGMSHSDEGHSHSDSDSDDDDEFEEDIDEGMLSSHLSSQASLAAALGPGLLTSCAGESLYNGGPVAGAAWLHGCASAGGQAVLPGVWLNGQPQALHAALERGQLAPQRLRFFVGEAGWSPGQLQEEVARGEWLLAAATPAWVLGAHAQATDSSQAVCVVPQARVSSPLRGARRPHAQGCLWTRALDSMGGEFAQLAQLPSELEDGEEERQMPFTLHMHV